MAAFEKKLDAMLGMAAEGLDAITDAYDNDHIEFTEADTVHDGSPLDCIVSKRETGRASHASARPRLSFLTESP